MLFVVDVRFLLFDKIFRDSWFGVSQEREKKKENDANQSNNNKTFVKCLSGGEGSTKNADVVVFVVVLSLPF
jgi:hypothetical protein